MGHDAHFLQRLDRLELGHVELALTLYRDEALLQYILNAANVPASAPRVALALHDSAAADGSGCGPHIVVTREGRFVTCLGRGMSPGRLPIISRARLDAVSKHAETLRERLHLARTLVGPGKALGSILQRVYEAGPLLSREEFMAMTPALPLYAVEALGQWHGCGSRLADLRHRMRKIKKASAAPAGLLHDYWKHFHALGHFAMLAAYNGPAPVQHLPLLPEQWGNLAWGAVRQNSMGLALRGLWAVAKLGKLALPGVRNEWERAGSYLTTINSGYSLCAIAIRHARYRAEIIGRLQGRGTAWAKAFAPALEATLEGSQEAPAVARSWTAGILFEAMGGSRGNPLKFASAAEIPDDIVLPTIFALQDAFVADSSTGIEYLSFALPWVVTAKAEELYMPEQYAKLFSPPFVADDAFQMIERLRSERTPTQSPPVRKDKPDPGANARCPCGSGSKYKRCCGRPVVRVPEKPAVPRAERDERSLADLPVIESFLLREDPDLRRKSSR